MTDMRRARLMQGANGDHTLSTLRVRVAHCPPPPVARKLSYPSWKVIVSASRGQYLKPGSLEPRFFLFFLLCRVSDIDRFARSDTAQDHEVVHSRSSEERPVPGTGCLVPSLRETERQSNP